MVIGVAISQFNRMKLEEDKSPLLTPAQQEWVTVQVGMDGEWVKTSEEPEIRAYSKSKLNPLQRMMASTQPKAKFRQPVNNPFRLWLFTLTTSPGFDKLMMSIILLNVLFMFMSHQGQGPT